MSRPSDGTDDPRLMCIGPPRPAKRESFARVEWDRWRRFGSAAEAHCVTPQGQAIPTLYLVSQHGMACKKDLAQMHRVNLLYRPVRLHSYGRSHPRCLADNHVLRLHPQSRVRHVAR